MHTPETIYNVISLKLQYITVYNSKEYISRRIIVQAFTFQRGLKGRRMILVVLVKTPDYNTVEPPKKVHIAFAPCREAGLCRDLCYSVFSERKGLWF